MYNRKTVQAVLSLLFPMGYLKKEVLKIKASTSQLSTELNTRCVDVQLIEFPFFVIFYSDGLLHSELGEAAESKSSFSRSFGEADCPPFTLFHFILLFWNQTLTWDEKIQEYY